MYCAHVAIQTIFFYSSGATISLFEGFGLLSYFLPFNQILDAFCPIIYFHDS